MKKLPLLAAGFGLLGLVVPTRASAAGAGNGPKAQIFAKFDTNKNGIIDGDEVEAVRKAYAADPKGQFAKYDLNHDGKLDDKEIAEIKPPGGGGKSGASKKAEAAPKKNDGEKKAEGETKPDGK